MNRLILSFFVLTLPCGNALAGDAAAGKAKATTVCAGCHGPNGISTNPLWPSLAGQNEAYMIKAIKDYRDGKREDPTMTPLAKTLSDKEIEDVSAYFAKLKPKGSD